MVYRYEFVYLGIFPPPHGGVTVKNALLFKHLASHVSLRRVDLSSAKRGNVRELCRLVGYLVLSKKPLIVAASTNGRKFVTEFLYRLDRTRLKRCSLVYMGGTVPDDRSYVQKLGAYKRIYVETHGMKALFARFDVKNVSIYPNCREAPSEAPTSCALTAMDNKRNQKLKCVFFSTIGEEKGAHLVLEAASELNHISFHMYGRIDHSFRRRFSDAVSALPNVHYHGVFDSAKNDPVVELRKYDVHLFPTFYGNEGVPGVIVESKFAGLPTIATDTAYNNELIVDQSDGIVLQHGSPSELVEAIHFMDDNAEVRRQMGRSAAESAREYDIVRQVEHLASELVG